VIRYLLDTNAVIALLNDAASALARRVRQEAPTEIAISAIVAHELFYGVYKSRRIERNLSVVDSLRFATIEFDKEDARKAGEIRALLASMGTPIGAYDVLIAGQAASRNLILITHNTAEFARVPGLSIEDWQS
jgi:tRNA(fMet)-specific endonuclease VapC